MKILVKLPTRSRGQKVIDLLTDYVAKAHDLDNIHFLISYDDDDDTMIKPIREKIKQIAYEQITLVGGVSESKIHACNRDINEYEGEWDIIVLASDDMLPQVTGWDTIIREAMKQYYPDTNGALWFNDGHQNRICTLSIMGRKCYNDFGYIYHPSYISLWCDNEWTEVLMRQGRLKRLPHVIIFHDHPMWTGRQNEMDDLYRHNEKFYQPDQANFNTRKAKGFPL